MSSQRSTPESSLSAEEEMQVTRSSSGFGPTNLHAGFQQPRSSADRDRSLHLGHTPQFHEYLDPAPRTFDLPFVNNPGITIPEVTFVEPRSGVPGSNITVYLRSRQPVELNPGPQPNLIFAGLQLPSQLWNSGHINGYYTYTVTALVPMMSTLVSPTICSLYLSLNDAIQVNLEPISAGNFEYWQLMEYPTYAPLQPESRKRRATSTSAGSNLASIKRVASQTFPGTSIEPSLPYSQSFAYPVVTTSQTGHVSYVSTTHGLPSGKAYDEVPYGSFYHTSHAHAQAPTAHLPAHASHPMYQHVSSESQSTSDLNVTASPRLYGPVDNGRSSGEAVENPVNIRTSFIRQPNSQPKLATQLAAPQFNPYSIPKATLQIQGDLKDALDDWTDEETYSRRRIVEFDRSQTGSIITASFRVVSRKEWDHTKISVNCIWWEERKEAFITSVDLISLLESIMALRFTLQEKNRIRRNLEGFRPLTIGKSKADKEPLAEDVEAFFRLIMGLGEPRPRSIEKDVKVFPWSSLATAMKKVVDKYSASYASTAGTMDTATHSRNLATSPLQTSTSQSDSTSSPARSVTQSADVDSTRESPYSSASVTTAALTSISGETALSSPAFTQASAGEWLSTEAEDSTYLYTSSVSDSYQLPDFASSSTDIVATTPSPLQGRDRSRRARGRHYAAAYQPHQK